MFIKDALKRYYVKRKAVKAVDGVDLNIHKGEIVSLVGKVEVVKQLRVKRFYSYR